MRYALLFSMAFSLTGCGPSAPPIPTDPDAIKREVEKEKEIRYGLEGAPPPKADKKK